MPSHLVYQPGNDQRPPRPPRPPRQPVEHEPRDVAALEGQTIQPPPATPPAVHNLGKPHPGPSAQLSFTARSLFATEIGSLNSYISLVDKHPEGATLKSLTKGFRAMEKRWEVCALFLPQETRGKFNMHKNNIRAHLQNPVGRELSEATKTRILGSAGALLGICEQLVEPPKANGILPGQPRQ